MSALRSSVVFYAVIISFGGFLFGFDASVISGAVGFIAAEFHLSSWQTGFLVAVPTLGGLVASFTMGPLADYLGRKKLLIVISILYLLSGIFSAFATSYEFLIFARFIGGVGFGSLAIAPMYVAEISPPARRGQLVSINQFNIVIGFSAAYFSNYFILLFAQSGNHFAHLLAFDHYTWRWMLGAEIVPAFFYVVFLGWVPESPRWLALNNRVDDAIAVMSKLLSSEDMDVEIKQIKQESLQKPEPLLEKLKGILQPSMRFALVIGVIISAAQQITGINAVYFYAPTIFEQSGIGTNAALSQAIWIGIVNIVFTIVAMLLIDRLGRKPLLIVGLVGAMLSLFLSAYAFHEATFQLTKKSIERAQLPIDKKLLTPLIDVSYNSDIAFKNAVIDILGEERARSNEAELVKAAININATWVLLGILGFVAAFAISLGPVMWVMLSEIFPNQLRAVAISAAGIVNAGTSFGVQLIFPWELSILGSAVTFFVYGLFALLALVLVVWIFPETKGKTLEQLTLEFSERKTLFLKR
jgi:MFS transporter, SP family, arabinose:H+ symporter